MLVDPGQCPPDLRDFAWGYLHGRTRQERWAVAADPSPVHRIAFASDGYVMATAGGDGTVRLWNAARPAWSGDRSLVGHKGDVWSVALAPDGRSAASGGRDGSVRFWDLIKDREIAVVHGHARDVKAVVYSPDGKTVVSGGLDGSLQLWNSATGALISKLVAGGPPVADLAFSPTGKSLAAACADQTVRVWNPKDGQERFTHRLEVGSVLALAFAPDGMVLAGGCTDRGVRIWDARSGRQLAMLRGHAGPVVGLAFAPQDFTLATLGTDCEIKLWDSDTCGELSALSPDTKGVGTSVAFSPDGGTVVCGNQAGDLWFWDVPDRKTRSYAAGHRREFGKAVYSPDGSLLATGQSDGTVRLSDSATGARRVERSLDTRARSSTWRSLWTAAHSPRRRKTVRFGSGTRSRAGRCRFCRSPTRARRRRSAPEAWPSLPPGRRLRSVGPTARLACGTSPVAGNKGRLEQRPTCGQELF